MRAYDFVAMNRQKSQMLNAPSFVFHAGAPGHLSESEVAIIAAFRQLPPEAQAEWAASVLALCRSKIM